MDEGRARKDAGDQAKMHFVERHLIREIGTPGCHDAPQLHLPQVYVPQFLETAPVVSHPQLGQGLWIGQGAPEPSCDRIAELVDERKLVARRDFRMARESLLHQRGSRTREAKNENRLGAVLPGGGWRHQAQALGDEELPQTVGHLAGFSLEIGLAGNFARPVLGRRETGEGFIVALELVEDPPLLQEHVGIGGAS